MNRNYKTNKPLFIGVLASGIYFFTKGIMPVPDVLQGFLIGIVFAGYFVGIYGLRHDISKLKEWKKSLLKRLSV
ncbi:MAG: hypothetical protein K0R09_1973 [Clostridiales bacterium]|jgi:hypothetical protein|nr:hypothetical protein [Clostridiales bacterium]